MLLYRTGPCRTNQAKPGLQSFCSTAFALSPRFSKKLRGPATTRPTIVLPDFARSRSAEKKQVKINSS
jgi:hypothetical protein